MRKLVRNNVPTQGLHPVFEAAHEHERVTVLLTKLVEEALEVRDSCTQGQRLEEMADVYEVLLALLACQGNTLADMQAVAEQKAALLGRFDNFTVLTWEKD